MVQQTFENKNIYKDFDLSFGQNPLTNDISKKTDANAITQSMRNLLNTSYYERPFRPEIGTNIRQILFEPADVITTTNLRRGIIETIQNHEPRIVIEDVYITDVSEMNAYKVNIKYRMAVEKTVHDFTITLRRLR